MADTSHAAAGSSSQAAAEAAQAQSPAPNQATPDRLAAHNQNQASRGGAAQSTPYAMDPNAYGQTVQGYHQQPHHQPQHQSQYGSPAGYYTPYAAYGQPQQSSGFEAVPQNPVPETQGWSRTKLVLHGMAVLFSIVCLALGIAVSVRTSAPWLAAVAFPVPIMSLVWSAAELTVQKVHHFQRGIHPGGQVAATLILWLACIIMAPLQVGVAAVSIVDCSNSDMSSGGCDGEFARSRGIWMALGAFNGLLFLIYFILFIFACIDTSRRNRSKRTVMVVNPGQYWPQPQQGWQALPQWQQPQPQQQQYQQPQQPQQQQPGIPLQNQAPAARAAEGSNEKRPEGAPAHGIQEYYGGGTS